MRQATPVRGTLRNQVHAGMSTGRRCSAGLPAAVVLIAAVAFAALCAVPAWAAHPGPLPEVASSVAKASAAGSPADLDPSLRDFGACAVAQRKADVLLLLDESASLQGTDPSDTRVVAANYLVDRLKTVAASDGLDLSVAVSGFSNGFDEGRWQKLDDSSMVGLHAAIESYRDRTTGIDTDYWEALNGARKQLRERTDASADAQPCQAVIWFTDGELDIDPRPSDTDRKPYAPNIAITNEASAGQVIAAATESICRSGGLADQIRSTGAKMLAVGLQPPGHGQNFNLITKIATGSAGGERCGAITSPDPGAFLPADNVQDLLFAFNRLGNPNSPPIPTPIAGVCVQGPCSERHPFVLDDSIEQVNVLAGASIPAVDVYVYPPVNPALGTRVIIRQAPAGTTGTLDAAGTPVRFRWLAPGTVSIDADRTSGGAWTGKWSVMFVASSSPPPGAQSRAEVAVTGNLIPAWLSLDLTGLRAAAVATGQRFGVVRAQDRTQVPAGNLSGRARMTVEMLAPGKQVALTAPLTEEQFNVPTDLNLRDVQPGPATLRLTLKLSTATVSAYPGGPSVPGTPLVDRTVDYQVTVQPPLNYPSILSRKIDFGSGENNATSLTASLSVRGPGCTWVDDARVLASPDGAGQISVAATSNRTRQTCLQLGPDQTGSIPVALSVQNRSTGTVSGTVQVHLAAANDPTAAPVVAPVGFTGDVTKANEGVKRIVFLVALLLGLGLPVLLLYGAKWWSARIPRVPLLCGLVPATLIGDRVEREGRPFHLSHRDLEILAVTKGSQRALAIPGTDIRLQTRWGGNPVQPAYVTVESGRLSISGTSPYCLRNHPRARLPLSIHNSWVALTDGETAANRAGAVRVLAMVSVLAEDSTFRELADDVCRSLPSLIGRLSGSVGGTGPAAPGESDGPGGGPGRGPGDGPDTGSGGGWDFDEREPRASRSWDFDQPDETVPAPTAEHERWPG